MYIARTRAASTRRDRAASLITSRRLVPAVEGRPTAPAAAAGRLPAGLDDEVRAVVDQLGASIPMIALLDAIWASSKNYCCSSEIAASIIAVSAGMSDGTAKRCSRALCSSSARLVSDNPTEANLGPRAARDLDVAVARGRGGHELVEEPPVTRAISSTARAHASTFACEGFCIPLILRTYCRAAARTSSGASEARSCRAS